MRLAVPTLTLGIMALLHQPSPTPLRQTGAIPMSVEGRIDHLAVDVAGRRLFVAALGNNSVEVIDLTAMRVVRSIGGMHEPQGIRFLPDRNRAVVANGGDGATVFLDGKTLEPVQTTKLSGDADNVRYDPKAGRVYVGYGNGALAIFDTDGRKLGDITLPAHPESFQLEANGPRIFVNVPGVRQIAVADRNKQAITAMWPARAAGANYPMALDEANRRLFVGCRQPARLLVYDTTSGTLVSSIDIVGDTDDLFYDPVRKRLYIIGGEGFITVLDQTDADRYAQTQKLPTAGGARTGLFVPELGTLFLAVPHRGAQRSEIRVFEVSSR